MKIDETDRRILKVLQKSGRISNSDLADKINLSASACHRRVQRLEDDGPTLRAPSRVRYNLAVDPRT